MPRVAAPRKWKDKFVTEAGGRMKVLCLIREGMAKARKELVKHLLQLEQEKGQTRAAGSNLDRTAPTVADAVREFLQFKKSTKSKRTFEYYEGYLSRLTAWYGDLEVEKVTLSHGNDFLSRLKDFRIPRFEDRRLGPVSINHHTQSARAVFNYCVECKWIATNPWRRLPKLRETGRRRIVTDEEFAKLLAACREKSRAHGELSRDENAELMRDILQVLRFTALRPGELRKLAWHHLHLENDVIVIPAEEHKTGSTTAEPHDRVVPFLEDVKSILERRRKAYGHHSRVFPNLNGHEWEDDVFSKRFARLRKRAGLNEPDARGERLCWYSLRHSRLTEVATKEGWDLHVIANYAGHSPKMTERYVHVNRDTLTRALIAGNRKRKEAEEHKP